MERRAVAVVIPCKTLNAYVLECLRACMALGHEDYRILLLPDENLVLPEDVARAVEVVPTGAVGISAKRNIGVGQCPETDYFAFIDSDAYPAANWLASGVAVFALDRSIWAVGGPNLTPPGEDWGQRAVGNALRSFLVSGALAFARTTAPGRYCSNLHACNLIVSARALAAAGGFHEGLRTGEDRELCHRLQKHGGKIYFSSDVVVYHHNRRLGTHFFLQRFVQGHSIYHIAAIDRDRSTIPLFIPPLAAVVLLAGVLAGMVHREGWIVAAALGGAYGAAAVVEAFRVAVRVAEAPLTLAAIVMANAGYVLGSLFGLLGRDRDLMALYRNYPGRDAN